MTVKEGYGDVYKLKPGDHDRIPPGKPGPVATIHLPQEKGTTPQVEGSEAVYSYTDLLMLKLHKWIP